MSIDKDSLAVAKDLVAATQQLSMAHGVLAAGLAVAAMMRDDQANVWKIVAAKRMIKMTRAYTASILYAADQLNAELALLNRNRKQGQDET